MNNTGHNMNNETGVLGVGTVILGFFNVVSNWSTEQWISVLSFVFMVFFGAGNLYLHWRKVKLEEKHKHPPGGK